MAQFRCRGCAETNTVVEISLVPRIAWVNPDDDKIIEYTGLDEAFWESETVLGFGCSNYKCKFWQGNYGLGGDMENGSIHVLTAPTSIYAMATEENE